MAPLTSEDALAMRAPKLRKHLSADALLSKLRSGFAEIADHRSGEGDIALSDARISAFAMFSLKAPSLLAFDKERTADNLQRVYGLERVPCATSRRAILDPVEPEALRPALKPVFRQLQRGKALEEMVCVEGHDLLALDGTGYFSSHQLHCVSCGEQQQRNGTVTYAHQMLGASRIPPDQREVLPLMPAPMIQQDGTSQNDCERNAAKRCIAKLHQDHPHLQGMVTADSLSSNAPHIELLQAHDIHYIHYILGIKEGDQAFLCNHVVQAEQAGGVTYYEREDAEPGAHPRFRFASDMPLNASKAELRVNFLECGATLKGKVPHCSWVTDLRGNKGTVYRLMQGGRARGRSENETFNTLKNQGDHFEHNFGHGYQHLSVVFAMLMLLALLVDQVQQLCCPLS
jgi:hypothetical protein